MSGEAELKDVLEAAGRSLADAQGALTANMEGGGGTLAISTAELELKTTVATRDGKLAVETLSSAAVTRGGIDPGLISTVRVNYVAVQSEPRAAAPGGGGKRSAEDITREVRAQADFPKLSNAYGDLAIKSYYVAEARRWLIHLIEPRGRIVRELVLPDDAGGK